MAEKFMSSNMDILERDYPELYKNIVNLNDCINDGKVLDGKTQKLVAIGIAAASDNAATIRQQMKHGIIKFNLTKDEIMDVLRIVLLLSGKPAFTKSVGILYSLFDE